MNWREAVKLVHPEAVILLLLFLPLITSAQEESMAMPDPRLTEASALMQGFARRTGLDSDHPPRRYLWTDAFAVCNFLGLARATGGQRYRELALRLVDQVHHVLGQYRDDDPRRGWISGLRGDEGEAHPTRGGLRIGKRLPERRRNEPFDAQLEWERDGQYFHYLTRWMHALDQVSRATGDPGFNLWARELAATAHEAFTYLPAPGRIPSMYWKMSIDLSRPLVPSMGQHDPLDGYLTARQLRATAAGMKQSAGGPDLEAAIQRYAEMTGTAELASADPLGIGGLLVDAYRVLQLQEQGEIFDGDFLERLLGAALAGLDYYARSRELKAKAENRLAFRELGLAIGLSAVERMGLVAARDPAVISPAIHTRLEALRRYVPLGEEIESFWRVPAHQHSGSWSEHQDINEVMLATRLAPDGFLVLAPPE